jgi:predicted RNA-binding protein with PIN domain
MLFYGSDRRKFMKRYILDANNIAHKHPGLRSVIASTPEALATAFVGLLASYVQRYPSYRFTVVFDGSSGQAVGTPRSVSVVSAAMHQAADDVIRQLIRNETAPGSCVVVSSDTEVYNFARAHSCTVMTADAFLREITPTTGTSGKSGKGGGGHGEKPSGVSRAELAVMKKLFGLE